MITQSARPVLAFQDTATSWCAAASTRTGPAPLCVVFSQYLVHVSEACFLEFILESLVAQCRHDDVAV